MGDISPRSPAEMLIRVVRALISRLVGAYRLRKTIKQLRSLSDRQLWDIGVKRHEIDKTVRDRLTGSKDN